MKPWLNNWRAILLDAENWKAWLKILRRKVGL